MRLRVAVMGVLVLGAAGCSRAEVYHAVYEALHTRAELVHPASPTRPATPRLGYAEYEAERERLLRDERAGSGRAVLPADRER